MRIRSSEIENPAAFPIFRHQQTDDINYHHIFLVGRTILTALANANDMRGSLIGGTRTERGAEKGSYQRGDGGFFAYLDPSRLRWASGDDLP